MGWAPASYLEPRDGSVDDQVLEVFEKGKGKPFRNIAKETDLYTDLCSLTRLVAKQSMK